MLELLEVGEGGELLVAELVETVAVGERRGDPVGVRMPAAGGGDSPGIIGQDLAAVEGSPDEAAGVAADAR
jgi:hypothetical protein